LNSAFAPDIISTAIFLKQIDFQYEQQFNKTTDPLQIQKWTGGLSRATDQESVGLTELPRGPVVHGAWWCCHRSSSVH